MSRKTRQQRNFQFQSKRRPEPLQPTVPSEVWERIREQRGNV